MIIPYKKIRSDAKAPIRASDGAIGYDVFASRILDKHTKKVIKKLPIRIQGGGSVLIGIGVQMAVPWPVDCQVRPRSGLASKFDIELSNSPGTVDPDFRGEVGVLLRNRSDKPFTIKPDMRIAQLIFTKIELPVFEEKNILPVTRRGSGGFGSTGFYGEGLGTNEYSNHIKRMDRHYMKVVLAVAERSTCVRGVKRINGKYERDAKGNFIGQTRKFGCVIVKNDTILGQGFNDQYIGSPKCYEAGCLREELIIPSGTQIEKCRAMHAEWWAFTNAGKAENPPTIKEAILYVNAEPCEICAKMIVGYEIDTVVLLKGIYPANGIKILKEGGVNIRYTDVD